jgi:hypothetical protein
MKPQLEMLKTMFDAIRYDHQCDAEEAYDMMMGWMAVKMNTEIQLSTPGIKEGAYNVLHSTFDLALLQSEKHDFLGDLMVTEGIIPSLPTQMACDAKAILSLAGATHDVHMPHSILVQNTWTGRDVMAAHNVMGDAAIYFGMEANLRLYRTTVLNMHIHRIPAQILFADSRTVDNSIDSENWRQSNLWNPIKPEKLKQN